MKFSPKMRDNKHSSLKITLAAALASASVLALVPMANAGTSNGSFSITSTVASQCGVAFSGNVALVPNTSSPATAATGTTGLTITCTGSSLPTAVSLAGVNDAHGGSTPYFHALSGGGGSPTYVTYGLTATNIGSAPYTDGTSSSWTGTFGSGPWTSTITVTSLALNTAAPGTYSDSVTATVTF
jgi:spore coat protein U-like protein